MVVLLSLGAALGAPGRIGLNIRTAPGFPLAAGMGKVGIALIDGIGALLRAGMALLRAPPTPGTEA